MANFNTKLNYNEKCEDKSMVVKHVQMDFSETEGYICSGNRIPKKFDSLSNLDVGAHQIVDPANFQVTFTDQCVLSGMSFLVCLALD